jgi:hypothetical protein
MASRGVVIMAYVFPASDLVAGLLQFPALVCPLPYSRKIK